MLHRHLYGFRNAVSRKMYICNKMHADKRGPSLGQLLRGPKTQEITRCTRKCMPACIRGGEGELLSTGMLWSISVPPCPSECNAVLSEHMSDDRIPLMRLQVLRDWDL